VGQTNRSSSGGVSECGVEWTEQRWRTHPLPRFSLLHPLTVTVEHECVEHLQVLGWRPSLRHGRLLGGIVRRRARRRRVRRRAQWIRVGHGDGEVETVVLLVVA